MVLVVVLDVDVGVLLFSDDAGVPVDVGVGAFGWAFGCGVGACPRWPATAGTLIKSTIAVTVTAVDVKGIEIPPPEEGARHVPAQRRENGRKTGHSRPEVDKNRGRLTSLDVEAEA